MRRGATLLFILLGGGLLGCGAGAARGDLAAAELRAQSARAQATREHARLLALEARLVEMERRSSAKTHDCEATPDSPASDVARARERPKPEPLRSRGDFLAEARVPAPAPAAPPPRLALEATPQLATSASERERLEQRLEGLREYAVDPRSGLSPERREALRVLLRRERQLDLMNPWDTR